MQPDQQGEQTLARLQRCLGQFERDELTAFEVVDVLLVDLINSEGLHLEGQIIGLLPAAVIRALQWTVTELLTDGSKYKGPIFIGRVSDERRSKIRNGLR